MENEAPTAPAAPASEATPIINSNPAPVAQPASPVADIPSDQIEAFNKFVNANGGFEKAFSKLRNDVSTPAPAPAPAPAQEQAQPVQPVQQQAPQYNSQDDEFMRGSISMEELAAKIYFDDLAKEPQYAHIADQVRTGGILKEMGRFNIPIMRNNRINDDKIRDFLNLYAKTVPTQAPSAPVTNTPTVDYVNVGEQVTSRDDAIAIINQNRTLKPGMAAHPQTEAAKEYLKKYFNGEIKK